jgi:hypothetical protein
MRNMIAYKDFVPQRPPVTELYRGVETETFDEAVKAANEWIQQQQGIKLLNVETVVLPNIWRKVEQGTRDADIRMGDEDFTRWHQFVRVWYEAG